jgi:hypothetical protein|tara:strand:+ start:4413 stop:4760 length:348 start_codon:yes stop_codon:yes gene_type:complete
MSEKQKNDEKCLSNKNRIKFGIFFSLIFIIVIWKILITPEALEKTKQLINKKWLFGFFIILIFLILYNIYNGSPRVTKASIASINAFFISFLAYVDQIQSAFWFVFSSVLFFGEV